MTTTYNFNEGWNAGAVSRSIIDGDVTVRFQVPTSVTGVILGLNSDSTDAGHLEIDHGVYFTHGQARWVENGTFAPTSARHTSSDTFSILRVQGVVYYQKNDVTFYISAVPSSGPVFVDASLYYGSDTIGDVEFYGTSFVLSNFDDNGDPNPDTNGDGFPDALPVVGDIGSTSSMPPLGGISSEVAYGSVMSTLPSLTSSSSEIEINSSNAVLPALEGVAADREYNHSGAQLPWLRSAANETYVRPELPNIILSDLPPILGWSRMLNHDIEQSDTYLQALQGFSADYDYLGASGTIGPLGTRSYTRNVPTEYGFARMPIVEAGGRGHDSTGEQAASITCPLPTTAAYGGGNGRSGTATVAVTATGTTIGWGKAAVSAPSATATASGTTTATASGAATSARINIIGYGGAVCSVTIDGATVQAIGYTGALGRAQIICPLVEVMAGATARAHGTADIICPMPGLGGTIQAWILAPSATVVAVGTATVTASYEAYAVNLKHVPRGPGQEAPVDEVAHYTNFPFTHVVRYRNSYYGANSTGLYLLEGTTDDDVPIPFAVKTGTTDFGSPEKKTVASAYFSGRFGPASTISLQSGEDAPNSYNFSTPRDALAQNHRQMFGKGVKEKYHALSVSGTDVCELDSIELDVRKTTRRV